MEKKIDPKFETKNFEKHLQFIIGDNKGLFPEISQEMQDALKKTKNDIKPFMNMLVHNTNFNISGESLQKEADTAYSYILAMLNVVPENNTGQDE